MLFSRCFQPFIWDRVSHWPGPYHRLSQLAYTTKHNFLSVRSLHSRCTIQQPSLCTHSLNVFIGVYLGTSKWNHTWRQKDTHILELTFWIYTAVYTYLLNIHYVPITLLSPGLVHINNIEPLPSSPSGSNRKTDEKWASYTTHSYGWCTIKNTLAKRMGYRKGSRKKEKPKARLEKLMNPEWRFGEKVLKIRK